METDLWARSRVDDGRRTRGLSISDPVILNQAESDAVRAAVAAVLNVAPEQVRVALTHNHAGPPPSGWDWGDGVDALRAYYGSLPQAAASAATEAMASLRPARTAVGRGDSRVAVNRREDAPNGVLATGVNPRGVIDPHVFVIRIDSVDERPLAAIVGYTMHPTTMGPTNKRFSADWPGHLKRMFEQITGATCLFVQGATGNVGPGPEGFTDDARVIRKLGGMVACEAARTYLNLHLPPVAFQHERIWESGAPLGKWKAVPRPEGATVVQAISREIQLPLLPQPPLAETEAELKKRQQHLRDLVQRGAPAAEVEAATFVTKRANMAVTRARTFGGKTHLPVELHVLRIGDAVMAAIPGEPFADIALTIKAQSPFPHTWFGGYHGAWYGYMPVPEEYPRKGYEVDTTPYSPDASGVVIHDTVSALQDLSRAGTAARG